jgi:predicted RNA binding protein YcfA (HicA-like mRNA interferase family)
MMNEKRVRTMIPMLPGKDIKPSLVREIVAEVGLTREEFLKLLAEA